MDSRQHSLNSRVPCFSTPFGQKFLDDLSNSLPAVRYHNEDRINSHLTAPTGGDMSHYPVAPASRNRQQILPQPLSVAFREQRLDFLARALPNRRSLDKQSHPRRREPDSLAAPVVRIGDNLDQSPPLQRFQLRGRERGSVHGQQRGHRTHRRRRRPVQGHQQRKLAVRQAKMPECLIESPRQRPRRPLRVKTKTRVPNQKRCRKWYDFYS